MQEKLFIQEGRFFLFFQTKIANPFSSKKPAVGLGQQGSQAVGSGFESLSCQTFLRFILNIFRYPKVMTQ